MATVSRSAHRLSRRGGLTALEQRFRFEGEDATAAALAEALMAAPLTGPASIFGERPGREEPGDATTRRLRGFSPAPGFRFDVELGRRDGGAFLVRFSQPERDTPYLQGELVWWVGDEPDGAVLDEQINTEAAMTVATEPLNGPRPSLRRWLFFRVGHAQVMRRATSNLASLLAEPEA